jgi:REP element-mobilizing transposase RayT
MSYHQRRSKRLKVYDYCSNGLYFITICTDFNDNVFGRIENEKVVLNNFGLIVKEEWIKTSQIRTNVELDAFIIMPNHIHGIIKIVPAVGAIGSIAQNNKNPITYDKLKSIKQLEATQFEKITHKKFNLTTKKSLQPNSLGSIIGQYKSMVTKNIRKMGLPEFRWQRNYYDRIIRSKPELIAIRKYIKDNPINYRE